MTDLGGKTCIFSHPVYLFLREFSLQDSRGGSICVYILTNTPPFSADSYSFDLLIAGQLQLFSKNFPHARPSRPNARKG
ncbi:hypothetical protein D3683_25350 [Escherichia coli]|nr:hypothetical protein [Escherichia coli]EFN9198533.1 hypothetical protein [Escherichia coli]